MLKTLHQLSFDSKFKNHFAVFFGILTEFFLFPGSCLLILIQPQGGNCKKFSHLFVFTSGFKLRAYGYNIRKIDGI